MLAVINAVPLFLGGRTNPLADFVGIPLSTYYIFHHFIGRVVFAEGVLHAALALRRSRYDQVSTSGYIGSGGLLLLFCTSIWLVRRYFFRSFAKIHFILALATLGATTWHTLCQTTRQAKIPVFLSGGLWVSTTVYRCIRIAFYTTGAKITRETGDSEFSRIQVHRDSRVRFYPGCYFYIFPSGNLLHYDSLGSFPMALMWYGPGRELETDVAEDLAFLVSHNSRPLRSLRFGEGERLLLDGPHGQNLGLQRFETVMLAAHGVGISGVLSFALYLCERRGSRGRLRRVNLLWSPKYCKKGPSHGPSEKEK
ncbi:hypothetical protein N656DRAFT_797609 [Canariomyces notabilis]|uniref:Ferric oxidoreductase domain-containing protein n=1 Tax=Canariomyces notabilis TaxID=2074819 RepID=A0AAN6TEQ4_9PEZI|nr:hypothetical protein N656DRAFT_797609 [Canariomyces arenarius]